MGYSIKRLPAIGQSIGNVDVEQGLVHNWPVSYNPDDERFYVERSDKTAVATFKEFRNAVRYCKTHTVV